MIDRHTGMLMLDWFICSYYERLFELSTYGTCNATIRMIDWYIYVHLCSPIRMLNGWLFRMFDYISVFCGLPMRSQSKFLRIWVPQVPGTGRVLSLSTITSNSQQIVMRPLNFMPFVHSARSVLCCTYNCVIARASYGLKQLLQRDRIYGI